MKMAWDWSRYFLGVTTFGGRYFREGYCFRDSLKGNEFFYTTFGDRYFQRVVTGCLQFVRINRLGRALNRRFHGRGRHRGSGANAAKFTVNVWKKS